MIEGLTRCSLCGAVIDTSYRAHLYQRPDGSLYPMNGDDQQITRHDRMLQFFGYTHLKPELQPISALFHDIAVQLVDTLPMNAERTVALRKLLEAKDCAVRAVLYKEP